MSYSYWTDRHRDRYAPSLWYWNRLNEDRRNDVAIVTEKPTGIEIGSVDLEIVENGRGHQTEKYELMAGRKALVVRRGQQFKLGIKFKQRPFDTGRDKLKIILQTGKDSSVPKGTVGVAVLGGNSAAVDKSADWGLSVMSRSRDRLEVAVTVPVSAPVGQWKVTLVSWTKDNSGNTSTFALDQPVYILFNPFAKNDTTFLADPLSRQEYLMEDMGKIYAGSHNAVRGRPWIFGQFQDTVLPTACHLLDIARDIKPADRANPIKVSRAISAVVNNLDERGVLVGRWDGKYEDGTEPYKWTGSVKILDEFMEGGGRPVKYGQCWVFAALVTTVCRSLGLACRPLTCYISAHDTNGSLTIDKYYDKEGQEVRGVPGVPGLQDSIWNFHCWNDVWMARPDLPKTHGGWQAIDATPQEESDNRYQLGPASVEAVKNGVVGQGYDTAFVFTEVNADVMVFVEDKESDWGFKRTDTNTTHVGRLILTKARGRNSDDAELDYEDITGEYKNAEGSMLERLSVMNAVRGIGSSIASRHYFPSENNQDMLLKIVDLDKGQYGQPYKVSLYLHNQSSSERTVKVVLTTSSVFYTGVKAYLVKKGSGEFKMKADERETLSMDVSPSDYMSRVVDMCIMKNHVLVTVQETGQTWSSEDDFVLQKPELKIKILDTPRVGKVLRMSVTFKNPLDIELTRCVFAIEAVGVLRSSEMRYRPIDPGEEIRVIFEAVPRKAGSTTVMVAFNSTEIFDVTGTRKMNVVF